MSQKVTHSFPTLQGVTLPKIQSKLANEESACNWLSHIQKIPGRPLKPVRRIYFPNDRSRRKHHRFGRKAAA